MRLIADFGRSIRAKAVKRTPDPLVLAIGLSLLAFGASWLMSKGAGLTQPLLAWSGSSGVWKLLRFSMQAALMLLLGGVLANAPIFARILSSLARGLKTPRQMVAATAGISVCLALINWSLCIVGGALIARECGQQAKAKGWQLHYPLLCSAGYCGMMVWHGGLSGTAPLKITRKQDLVEILGPELGNKLAVIPLEDTVFSPLNLAVNLGLLVIAVLGFYLLTPKPGQDPNASSAPDELAPDADLVDTPALRQRILGLGLGSLFLLGFLVQLAEQGVSKLDLNLLNLGLWALSLLAHGRLDRWLRAVETNISGCAGILVQFPLYAGIMGLLIQSGISSHLAQWMSSLGGQASLLATYASAAMLNLFVPSGGGQWAIQGPILLDLAARTGQSAGPLVMAMAYGDQLTNMVQPFWALPLLGITKVRARDISGYCLCWMLVGGAWIALMLLVFSA